ncbi:MAG: hypothetical protein OJF49_003788 [Ktedonobacterales bacterium]|jgi:hypothetical protein|nr:MAG: hypothetical protein OJF49_003788 [Ktedonobacterales bacterium]
MNHRARVTRKAVTPMATACVVRVRWPTLLALYLFVVCIAMLIEHLTQTTILSFPPIHASGCGGMPIAC